MREMKDSGIEWVGKIPEHWSVMHNKYIMTKKKTIKEIYGGEDIISLSMNGVIVRDLDAGGKMPKTFDGYQIVHPGNLLMCLFDYDVTPRCIGLIKNFGVTSPAYSQFVMNKNNHSGYYNYYYLMVDHTKALLHLAKNLRHSFTEEQLGSISAPVPPIEEQIEIEKFLDQKCYEIDAISSNIQKQIAILEDYKKSVITEAVTKGLNPDVEMKDSGIEYIGKIPCHWTLYRLKYILNERNSRSATGTELLLSVSQYKGVIPSSEIGNRTMQADCLVGYKQVKKDDLVFNKLNPGLARFGTSHFDGITSPDFSVYIVDKEKCSSVFLQYLLKTYRYVAKIKGDCTGVGDGFSRLYSEQLYRFVVALPTMEELESIVEYIETVVREIDSLVSDKKKQFEILADYKKSLIYEYVTGKKEVPES